jgi:hypothetical protein
VSRRPTGKKRGRPALPPDLRRVSLSLWILATNAEMIRHRAALRKVTPGAIVDELVEGK